MNSPRGDRRPGQSQAWGSRIGRLPRPHCPRSSTGKRVSKGSPTGRIADEATLVDSGHARVRKPIPMRTRVGLQGSRRLLGDRERPLAVRHETASRVGGCHLSALIRVIHRLG